MCVIQALCLGQVRRLGGVSGEVCPTLTQTHTCAHKNVGGDKVTLCLCDTWSLSKLSDNWSPLTARTHVDV